MTNDHDYRDPAVDRVADLQRKIQQGIDTLDSSRSDQQKSGEVATQASVHEQPVPPSPAQHLQKPGLESDLEVAPQFMATGYRGSGKLQDMAG